MPRWDDIAALEIDGVVVSLADVLRVAKGHDGLAFIDEAIRATLIRQAADEQAISVSDEELQQVADEFRAARNLDDEEAVEDWLTTQHLTFEDWEALIELDVTARKLRTLVTSGATEQYFAEHARSWDSAAISRLIVADPDAARELCAQIAEEGADFHVLARAYSIDDDTRPAGGYVGMIQRADFAPSVAAAVFGHDAGAVLGPFQTEGGWELIKVEALRPATLDDTTRERITTQLFDEWVAERRRRTAIQIPLLQADSGENLQRDEASPDED